MHTYTYTHIYTIYIFTHFPLFLSLSLPLAHIDNKFICDCRLQWIFELRNRTRHQQLRDSLENFICALQEPKLSHFVDPVPSHILDLLNFGGFTAIGSNSASMGGIGGIGSSSSSYANLEELSSNNGLTMKKHSSSKSRQALRGQRQFTDNAENVVESKLRVRRKRQQQPEAEIGGVAAVAQTQKRYDYYDDTNGNAHASSLGLTHGLDMDDNLNLHKQSSFYGASGLAHNDVELQHQLQPQAGDALDTMANKNSLNVHLFILKPDMLPCHDELSDPTELPLSRDLMDVRSNAGQDLLINGANPMQLTLGQLGLLSSLTLMLLLSQG